MQPTENRQPTVVCTSRGLSIAGTRITLYTILDYLHAGWPPKLIQDWLNLTDSQMADVLTYLTSHGEDVEQEYQQVVQHAEELRRYWDKRVQEHLANRPATSLTPERAKLRAKLQAWKTRLPQQ
jgi:uncharacterized protein (DUF433 family)